MDPITYFGAGLLLALVHLLCRPGKYWAPEDALYLFRKANERMNLARDQLPPGATPAQREEHSTYFKNSIATLERGAITASENVDF